MDLARSVDCNSTNCRGCRYARSSVLIRWPSSSKSHSQRGVASFYIHTNALCLRTRSIRNQRLRSAAILASRFVSIDIIYCNILYGWKLLMIPEKPSINGLVVYYAVLSLELSTGHFDEDFSQGVRDIQTLPCVPRRLPATYSNTFTRQCCLEDQQLSVGLRIMLRRPFRSPAMGWL